MPTKHDAPLRIMRAAAMVIISSAEYLLSDMGYRRFQTALEFIEILGAQHVALHPGLEGFSLARDGIPLFVEGVVPRIITLRAGWKPSTLHFAYRADYPGRQHHGVGRRIELIDNFFHGDDD